MKKYKKKVVSAVFAAAIAVSSASFSNVFGISASAEENADFEVVNESVGDFKPIGEELTVESTSVTLNDEEGVALDENNFQDLVFRRYLYNKYDKDSDMYLSASEISKVTSIDLSFQDLTSLKGIEYFTNLTSLSIYRCGENLTSLDVSKNTALTYLSCYGNKIESLDLSSNTALEYLNCSNNDMKSLTLGNMPSLKEIYCNSNQLETLDVSLCKGVTILKCEINQLETLDVRMCTDLTSLTCSSNQLTSLDLSNNNKLTYLNCDNNNIKALNLSNNKALRTLWCQKNQLTSLDFSSNLALTTLYCKDNEYSLSSASLDELLSYGFDPAKASEWKNAEYDAETNSLVNVTQNTVTYEYNAGYKNKLSFTLNVPEIKVCDINAENFPDNNFRTFVLNNIDRNGDKILSEREVNVTNSIYYNYSESKNLKGIEYFTKLTYLSCYSGAIKELDLSKNVMLNTLYCYKNNLTSLDLSGCNALTELYCYENQLTSLDLSDCTALTIISCNENKLTSLDLSNDTALESLECSTNQLTSLDVSDCTALTKLYCNSNQLTSLDVSNNKALTKLNCGGNQLTVLDVSNNTALTGLGCFNNKLTALDVSSCTALEVLLCNVNPLKSLDLSKNTALTKVSCGYTNLTSLDLSGNVNILTVICDHNEYTLSSTSLDELKQYGFDPAKASNWSGASYNAATNSLVNVTSEYVSYTYDLGNGFTETFTLIVTIPKVPAKPTNVTATPGDKQVALSWTAAEGATSYTIYKYENGKYAKINSTASTTYTVTGLTNGTTYKFLVRAFNATGGNAFTTADLVSATPKAAVPAKPTNVKATAGDKQVTLSWSAATGATSYTIYKYENGKYVKINSTASTTYTVTGLTNGTTYKFLVRAFNTAGGNSFTTADLVSATPKAAAATVPAKPTVTANVQDKVVTFSWNAVAGATYYKLYNYSDGKYGLIATVTDTTYRLRYLKNGTTYKVLVRAFNEKGGSKFTTADLITVTPKAATAVPTAPSVKVSVSGGNVNLTWAHVPTAFSYTIYKYENGTYTKLGATCDNYFTVKGLATGKTYSILVRAFNSKGGHKVTSSNRVSVTH